MPGGWERYGVAPSTAGNWHRLYRDKQSYAPLAIGGDRRSKLLGEADWIVAHLAETPDLRLLDVQHALAARGAEASYSSVQRTVKRLGGTVRISVCGRAVEHYAAMALMKRSPKMTANWALAMDHSRGGIFHSFSDRFKIR